MHCNYELDMALLTNGIQLKACDFEPELESNERKSNRKATGRAARRKATIKAKRRKEYAKQLRKAKQFKAERDNEMWFFRLILENGMMLETEIHDSKLWKPLAKR